MSVVVAVVVCTSRFALLYLIPFSFLLIRFARIVHSLCKNIQSTEKDKILTYISTLHQKEFRSTSRTPGVESINPSKDEVYINRGNRFEWLTDSQVLQLHELGLQGLNYPKHSITSLHPKQVCAISYKCTQQTTNIRT